MGYLKEVDRNARIQVMGGAFGVGLGGLDTRVETTQWERHQAPFFHIPLFLPSMPQLSSLLSSHLHPVPQLGQFNNLWDPKKNETVQKLLTFKTAKAEH